MISGTAAAGATMIASSGVPGTSSTLRYTGCPPIASYFGFT